MGISVMSKIQYTDMLRALYDRAGSEIDTCYKDLDLIKNAGVALAILTAIFTYIGYTVSSNAIFGYASFSFCVFLVLFVILNLVAGIVTKKTKPQDTNTKEIDLKRALDTFTGDLASQIFMPPISSIVLIFFCLFLLRTLGLAYSGAGLNFHTLFALTGNGYIDNIYVLSVSASIVSLILSLRKDIKISFLGYAIALAFILFTSILFVGYRIFTVYSEWLSYQLWLALIIELLLYAALMQYKYAINARLRISKYKNALSIVKAKAEYLLTKMPQGRVTKAFSETCCALEAEYDKLEKPKLVIAEGLPLLLQGYITIDMNAEVNTLDKSSIKISG